VDERTAIRFTESIWSVPGCHCDACRQLRRQVAAIEYAVDVRTFPGEYTPSPSPVEPTGPVDAVAEQMERHQLSHVADFGPSFRWCQHADCKASRRVLNRPRTGVIAAALARVSFTSKEIA
jgi:hypothetical protein